MYNPGHYPGSKATDMRTALQLLPPHSHFVSVFGGIGGEIVSKPESKLETFNDINKDVVNAFQVLRDRKEDLIKYLCAVPYSVVEFERHIQILQSEEEDQFKRACAFWTVANQSRGYGDPTIASSWCMAYHSAKHTTGWANIDAKLDAVARRFRSVQLCCRDWSWVLEKCDSEETLFSIDPPFLLDTCSGTKLYRHNMTALEHERMLLQVRKIRGMALVWHYPCKLYNALLSDWRVLSIARHVQISESKVVRPGRTPQILPELLPRA